LRSCKDVKILASSREALGVEGELAWRVPSLSLPDINHLPAIEQLSQYEAVRLFIERATLVQPHFSVTKENAPALAQICFRLDGIPLALELAAARASVLTMDQIAKRLDDRFRLLTGGARTALPRQQTLRAMIDWSYNLLPEQEQLLFRRLAVFSGGWTLEAAESVCGGEDGISGGGIESYLVLNLLSQLVNKSLVVMTEVNGESRYHTLETIRQYGREKLFETDEASQIRNRHLDTYIQLAEQGFVELQGSEDLFWIQKLDMENDNFRAALRWSLESLDIGPQVALQLSGALQDFWDTRGYTIEGYQWLSAALKKAPDPPTSQRCRALVGAGLLCIRLSRFKDVTLYLEEALQLARQLDNAPMIIISLCYLVMEGQDLVDTRKGFDESMALARLTRNQLYLAELLWMGSVSFSENALETSQYIEEAHRIAERLGNTRLRALVIETYGEIEMRRANYAAATSMLQDALRLSQQLDDKHTSAHCLLALGRVATRQGDFDIAFQYEEASLKILRDLSDSSCSMECLFHLGWNCYLAGKFSMAIEYLEECLSLCNEVNDAYKKVPAFVLGRIAASQENLKKAKGFLLSALEAHKKLPDSPYYLAYCLEAVCAIPGLPPHTTARLLGSAEGIREQKGFVLGISERPLVDPILERLQAQLGKEALASELLAGRTLTIVQAIDTALEALQNLE
jgi:predicted ATPase